MTSKINISFIVIGVFAIVVFILLAKFTYISRDIRINGEIKQCPIVRIDYAIKGGNHANIMIDGKELPAGRLIDNLEVGDTIAVRFIEGESRVVQDSVALWRYYLYFGLECILFLLGIVLIIGGLKGKTIYDSYIPKNSRKKSSLASKKMRITKR